ncbi:oxidoreductase [Microbacteriaceae bacterium VKM Ac-2854]|nr:oxidoreductase [Microbacteriaceae bacterium VKM Ac-2854]
MRERLRVIVREKRMLTPEVCRLVFARADGGELTANAGDHIVLHTPAGAARSYSVTDARDGTVAIAVLRESAGRGGSVSAVDDTAVGQLLEIDAPHNTFPLVTAPRYLLIAGGIGITAIRPMWHALRASGADVELLYLTRTAERTAFAAEFVGQPGVTMRHSIDGRLDLWPWLAEPDDELHLYVCASPALLEEVRLSTMHWRASRVHTEDFAGVSAEGGAPFTAVWRPTGAEIAVPGSATLLSALRSSGLELDSSCESGTCGSCVLTIVEGEAEHRDLVLDPSERATRIMPCVSRARSDRLVLDR